MLRRNLLVVAAVFALMSPAPAFAYGQILIQSPASIKWAISGGKVYLRNLNELDSAWLGCCYNFYFDLATDEGRAMFSAFLTARSSGQPIILLKSNPAVAGPIEMVGNW